MSQERLDSLYESYQNICEAKNMKADKKEDWLKANGFKASFYPTSENKRLTRAINQQSHIARELRNNYL